MPQEKTPAKRKSHGRVPQAYGTIDPEFSSKVLKHSMELLNIRKDKPKTREEMIETISSFFEICEKYSMIPTVEGLSIATHYDRTTLWDFETGRRSCEFADIVKDAKEIIKQYDAAMAANGMIPSSVFAFTIMAVTRLTAFLPERRSCRKAGYSILCCLAAVPNTATERTVCS